MKMSSHPPGLRFSPFSSAAQSVNTNNNNSNNNNTNNKIMQAQQQQSQQPQHQQQSQSKNNNNFNTSSFINYSDSETDISNSIENLSLEERFVLRHTARVEPQGQENMQENLIGRYINDNRLSSNTSTDSTRYASSNRSMSETRNPIYSQPPSSQSTSISNTNNNNSNRNSLKEANSNRSSMDVSTCSYNTLIIHNDDHIYATNRDYSSPPPFLKKERPRSYGEKGMQEITEIPDDYLDQSHVLKHLAKEVKSPTNKSDSVARDSGLSENTDSKENQKYNIQWSGDGNGETNDDVSSNGKVKSKSQPDLTKLGEIDLDTVEILMKENAYLKQQLSNCLLKVAKTQKLEEEVAKIYRAHEELEQSCQRREKLELTIRTKLQNDIHRAQELNRVLRDQVEVHQSQLVAPSEHQILIAQLFTQNKELAAAKERQEIELAAQRATLQEQRNHIGILDSALTNTQNNMRRLEEELRKKQIYIEHLVKLQQNTLQSKQNERKLRLEYDNELSKDSNRSGSSTNSESKWQLHDKDGQIMRLENECAKLEQRHLEETAIRQSAAQIVMEKNSQEADRIIAEAKQEKLRYLEEVHAAQRKVGDLQNHLKGLESRLAEKDALIRALQGQKNYGSSNSYDSYNLSNDSFTLNPLVYNSQASFNVSNSSFNTTANTSLLDPSYGQNSGNSFSPSASYAGAYVSAHTGSNYGQTTPTYNQSALNLQSINIPSTYTQSSSNYNSNFVTNPNYTQNQANYETSYDHQYDAARKSIDDHMKKQLDEQLSKRGLCCFPGLSGKKPIQSLLSDEVSVLSTNNSDAFLQKLAHIDQRERERQEHESINQSNSTKTEEIVLLEKQGRCSQKLRNNTMGNLAQVSHSVGQNMTDISNIGSPTTKVPKCVSNLTQNLASIAQNSILPPRKDRGSSLPPSALPRPPRSLKPPRKIDYDRLNDADMKKRSQTPPKSSSSSSQRTYELKTSSLKRGDLGKREYSPSTNYKIKHKNYGSMSPATEYPSTKNYQRLEDAKAAMKNVKESSPSLKRSLLPSSSRSKIDNTPPTVTSNLAKTSRDSINSGSSGSNNSNNSRSSPVHIKTDSNASNIIYHHHGQFHHARTPPKYIRLTPPPNQSVKLQQQNQPNFGHKISSSIPHHNYHHQSNLPSPTSSSASSLPPKPATDLKVMKRGNSVTRNGENRYRIQF